MRYELGRASRLGNREINQDRFAVLESEQGVLLVLGDGLGGRSRGELASQTLIEVAAAHLARHPLPAADPPAYLRQLLLDAHRAVLAVGHQQQPPVSPGTTAVACLVQDQSAWWAHVGDSRLYLIRKGVPLYRTRDHSFVERLYQAGQISLDRRQGHPLRNYVTQCIGLRPQRPEITLSKQVRLKVGDVLLLCTDGFWEPLDDARLGAGIGSNPLNEALNALAGRAEEDSYPNADNISALALRVESLTEAQPAAAGAADADETLDSLARAIGEIERAIREYEKEMKG